MNKYNPKNIEFGDYVEVIEGSPDAGIKGRVISIDPSRDRAGIDRSWTPGDSSSQLFSWHVILSRLKIIKKNELQNPEEKFTREDILKIIDQDKTAEEIVLDLKDHVTN